MHDIEHYDINVPSVDFNKRGLQCADETVGITQEIIPIVWIIHPLLLNVLIQLLQ